MPASKGALVKTTDAHPPPPIESRKKLQPQENGFITLKYSLSDGI